MFNLLTEKEKKFLRIEYRRRRFIVWCGLFIALFVIAMVFLIPSFAFLYSKTNFIFSDGHLYKKEKEGKGSLEIEKARKLISLFNKDFFATSSTYIVENIINNRTQGLKINSFGFSFGDKRILQVQGIASNRESLKKFYSNLESSNLFENFDIPIASFTRDSNIPFNVILNIKESSI